MNAGQLLEVATKVCVNRDQEAKWRVNRKMKKRVDLLAVALAGQLGKLQCGGHGRRGNPRGWWSAPQSSLTLERN
jgi:hypothetical protein